MFLEAAFLIKFQPQITDSLFAISNFLLCLVNSIVGLSPAIPGISAIVISDFLKFLILSILFKIITLFFLNSFLILLKIL